MRIKILYVLKTMLGKLKEEILSYFMLNLNAFNNSRTIYLQTIIHLGLANVKHDYCQRGAKRFAGSAFLREVLQHSSCSEINVQAALILRTGWISLPLPVTSS